MRHIAGSRSECRPGMNGIVGARMRNGFCGALSLDSGYGVVVAWSYPHVAASWHIRLRPQSMRHCPQGRWWDAVVAWRIPSVVGSSASHIHRNPPHIASLAWLRCRGHDAIEEATELGMRLGARLGWGLSKRTALLGAARCVAGADRVPERRGDPVRSSRALRRTAPHFMQLALITSPAQERREIGMRCISVSARPSPHAERWYPHPPGAGRFHCSAGVPTSVFAFRHERVFRRGVSVACPSPPAIREGMS